MLNNNVLSNKKTLLFALILAIVLALFAYAQVGINLTNNKLKELDEESREEINSEDLKILDYIDNSTETNTIEDTHTYEKQTKMNVVKEEVEEDTYHTLMFDTNGGKELDKQVLSNSQVTTSKIPVRESWIFDGWFTDPLLTQPFIFGNVLEKDTTIYAKWVKYVRFVNEDLCIKTITVGPEEFISLPVDSELIDIVSDNYIVKWFYLNDDSSKIYVTNTTKISDLNTTIDTITLNLEKTEAFNLLFYLDEDSEEFYKEKVVIDEGISFDEVNKKVIEFNPEIDITTIGWYYYDTDGNKCDFTTNGRLTSDITKLYLSGTYKIIYTEEDEKKDNGLIKIWEQNVVRNSKITNIFETQEKENKEFEGWFIIDNDVLTDCKLEEGMFINKDMTVVGKWKDSEIIDSYENIIEK